MAGGLEGGGWWWLKWLIGVQLGGRKFGWRFKRRRVVVVKVRRGAAEARLRRVVGDIG